MLIKECFAVNIELHLFGYGKQIYGQQTFIYYRNKTFKSLAVLKQIPARF